MENGDREGFIVPVGFISREAFVDRAWHGQLPVGGAAPAAISGPLPPGALAESDGRRLELHLQTCRRCQGLATEYRSVGRLLGRLGQVCEPDPVAIGRILTHLEKVLDSR